MRQLRGGDLVAAGGVGDVADDLEPIGVGAPDVRFAVVPQTPGQRLDPRERGEHSSVASWKIRSCSSLAMTCSAGDSPASTAYSCSRRLYRLLTVPTMLTDICRAASGRSWPKSRPGTRSMSSAAAFFVKVVARIWLGRVPALMARGDFAHQAVGFSGSGAGRDHCDVAQGVVHDRSPLRPQSAEKLQKLQGGVLVEPAVRGGRVALFIGGSQLVPASGQDPSTDDFGDGEFGGADGALPGAPAGGRAAQGRGQKSVLVEANSPCLSM